MLSYVLIDLFFLRKERWKTNKIMFSKCFLLFIPKYQKLNVKDSYEKDGSTGKDTCRQVWWSESNSWASYDGRRKWLPLIVLWPLLSTMAHAWEHTANRQIQTNTLRLEDLNQSITSHPGTGEHYYFTQCFQLCLAIIACIDKLTLKEKTEPSVLFVSENPSPSLVNNA